MRIDQYLSHVFVAASTTASMALVTSACRPEANEGVFLIVSGQDTISIEQYRRTRDSLEVELTDRAELIQSSLHAALGAGDDITELRLRVHRLGAPDTLPDLGTARFSVGKDSVTAEAHSGDGSWNNRAFGRRPDMVPYLDLSLALVQDGVKRARKLGVNTVTMLHFAVLHGGGTFARVKFKQDSVVVNIAELELRLAIDTQGNLRGGSIPARDARIEHAYIPYANRITLSKPDYSAPKDAPYTADEVTVPLPGGQALAGTLTRPKVGVRRVPSVILISGGGPQDRNGATPAYLNGYRAFRQIADTLGRRGVAVLRLDDPGTGGSSGDPHNTTAAEYARGIEAAVQFLRRQPTLDKRRIALLGHSEGGSVATMVAAVDRSIRGIVLLAAPARTGKRVMLEQTAWLVAHDTSLSKSERDSVLAAAVVEYDVDSATAKVRRTFIEGFRATLERLNSPAGERDSMFAGAREWDTLFAEMAPHTDSMLAQMSADTNLAALVMPASLRFFLRYDPVPAALKVRAPVLLLQGDADRQVGPEQATELAAAFRRGGNSDVTVRLFENVNHLFLADSVGDPRRYRSLPSQLISPTVLGPLADWLVGHLQ